jgi:hypothetical protein
MLTGATAGRIFHAAAVRGKAHRLTFTQGFLGPLRSRDPYPMRDIEDDFADGIAAKREVLASAGNRVAIIFLKGTGLKPKRTSVRSPWQNGIAERWVGSCRREILDHVIPLNEEHFRRLIRDYANYYHDDRIHDSLEKDTPDRRPVENKPSPEVTVISSARLGGLHHRYGWRQAA